jgi:quinol monooxygenase YgiN
MPPWQARSSFSGKFCSPHTHEEKRSKVNEVHVVATFQANADLFLEAAEVLAEFVGPSRKQRGCLYYQVLQDREDPARFVIADGWSDEAAFNDHIHSLEVKNISAKLIGLLADEADVRTFTKTS